MTMLPLLFGSRIHGAIDNSVRAAYEVFGCPGNDHREPCMSEDKWMDVASYAVGVPGLPY